MNARFYRRLAWNNIKKNSALYGPNILAGIGLTAVFYILAAITQDQQLHELPGARYLTTIMPLGLIILAILSFILILYSNSFLMKQRNWEFGLYNVLGMDKQHIGKILFWETAICSFIMLIGGLSTGILFYKFCTLLICRILTTDRFLGLYFVSIKAWLLTIVFFLCVHLLTYLFNRIRIARMKPTELLQSIHAGEQEPKVKWPLLLIGLLSLGSGYYISITTAEPLNAIKMFFMAVLLVIIGTYCLFIAGSIAILKMLKRNAQFYYQKEHMVTISGLFYRMKQNAVGLASITILATMVLVMLSTTISMYSGINETIERQYPHQIIISANQQVNGETIDVPSEDLFVMVRKSAEANQLTLSFSEQQHYLSNAFYWDGTTLWMDQDTEKGHLVEGWFITAEEYHRLTGESLNLSENQIAIYSPPENKEVIKNSITIGERTFEGSSLLNSYPIFMEKSNMVDKFGFVVSNDSVFEYILSLQKKDFSSNFSPVSNILLLDFKNEDEAASTYNNFTAELHKQLQHYVNNTADSSGKYTLKIDSKWTAMEDLKGMYGTLLFLGLMLSVIFLFATALIIYFKQLSEGYADRKRFQILRKVGMSDNEIKNSIRSQIRLVFFLPLLIATIHLAFVYPILIRMPEVLFQSNKILVIGCMLASLCVFVLVYVLIYHLTAKAYYKIIKKCDNDI